MSKKKKLLKKQSEKIKKVKTKKENWFQVSIEYNGHFTVTNIIQSPNKEKAIAEAVRIFASYKTNNLPRIIDVKVKSTKSPYKDIDCDEDQDEEWY